MSPDEEVAMVQGAGGEADENLVRPRLWLGDFFKLEARLVSTGG